MSPSSIYSTWGDKEGLFRAALSHYAAGPGSYAAAILSGPGTAKEAVSRIFQRAAIELTQEGQPAGCMVALCGNQGSPSSQAVKEASGSIRCQSRNAMIARLKLGQEAGELSLEVDLEELAAFYATVLFGMSIQARDGATAERLQAVGRRAMLAWPSPETGSSSL